MSLITIEELQDSLTQEDGCHCTSGIATGYNLGDRVSRTTDECVAKWVIDDSADMFFRVRIDLVVQNKHREAIVYKDEGMSNACDKVLQLHLWMHGEVSGEA